MRPLAIVLFVAAWLAVSARVDAAPRPPDAHHVFLADCAYCHGADAHGTSRAPSLVGTGRAATYFQLATGRMPRGETVHYDRATIDALVEEVARLAGDEGPAIPSLDLAHADVANGGELYRLNCAACHAWSGEGGALFEREAPSIHPDSPLEVASVVRAGSQNMPAFGTAALTDRQLDDVVAYVRELDHARDRGGNPLWHLGPFAEGLIALGLCLPFLLAATRWIGERA